MVTLEELTMTREFERIPIRLANATGLEANIEEHRVLNDLLVHRGIRHALAGGAADGFVHSASEMEALGLWLDSVGINGTKAQELHRRTEQYLEVVR